MLPTLAALLAGVIFLGRLHTQAADARALARRCAWQYAADGCTDIPQGCSDVLGDPSTLADEHSRATDGALMGARRSTPAGDGLSLPLLDRALEALVGRVAVATVSREVALRPGSESGTTVRATFATLCNAEGFDPVDELERVFCDRVGFCGGS